MPKPNKSSASAGTRKKHAKKGGEPTDDASTSTSTPRNRPQRGEKKLSKAQRRAQPKVKQYVPPPKPPAPLIPDPLDGQGLARTLPAELVVVLRRLGKKDDVTRRKGLEELREWVQGVRRGGIPGDEAGGTEGDGDEGASAEDREVEREMQEATLVSAVPVWLHHLASLLQSPFHRSSALQLHGELLAIDAVKTAIIDALSLGLLPGTQNRDVLGSWLVAALDEDRRGGMRGWDACTTWSEGTINLSEQLPLLIEYSLLATLDPLSLHDDIHPAPVSSAPPPPPPKKGGKAKPEPEPEPTPEEVAAKDERAARYRVGGLSALAWLVPQLVKAEVTSPVELLELLRRPILWSSLSAEQDEDGEGSGYEQPAVRKAAWALLGVLLESVPQEVAARETLEMLSEAVLSCCWAEKDAGVWQVAGPTLSRFLSKHREAWQIASRRDDGDNDGDDDVNEDDLSSPFADFLSFISTICPLIPHLTYPLLVIFVSSLPDDILPFTPSPSLPLETLLSHLWSPVDARLLSTHTMGNQPSVFQAFFAEALDCIGFLLAKAKRKEASETVQWLVCEHLGGRAWVDGVLEYGARGRTRKEVEAETLGRAIAKALTVSEDVLHVLPAMREVLLERAFEEDGRSKAALSLLPRVLPMLAALRDANEDERVLREVDEMTRVVAERSAAALSAAVRDQHPAAAVLAELLVQVLASDLPHAKQTLRDDLQVSADAYANALSPALLVSLFDAVTDDNLSQRFWQLVDTPALDQMARFALASSLVALPNARLRAEGCLDNIAVEAAQSALHDGRGTLLAVAAVRESEALSEDAAHTVLALVCTEIHDKVDDLLNGSDVPVPISALEIFAAYAEETGAGVVRSDIHVQALVAVHHLTHLLPRNSLETFEVPPVATKIWAGVARLTEGREVVDERVELALADMLGQVSCRIQPAVLVDVALSSSTPELVLQSLLPPTDQLVDMLADIADRPPHPSLCAIEPLAPYSDDSDVEGASFDAQGRSRSARYIDALAGIMRADRSIAQRRPELLAILLQASVISQEALDVPGYSRGLRAPNAAAAHLIEFTREVEGSVSFSVAAVDEADVSWHTAAVQAFRTGDGGDWLQRLLVLLTQDATDVKARALRDVLGRRLRQSGAGGKEAAVWLNYALTLAERAPLVAMAIVYATKPILLDTELFTKTQNRLASALTTVPPGKANHSGIPALRLLLAAAPPPDAPSVFLPQQRALLVLRHIGSWLASDDADDFDEGMEAYVAQLYSALAPVVQDLSGAHWDAIYDLVESGLEGSSLADPATHALLYESLLLLQQIRDLCSSNKTLRATWAARDQHLALVLGLFLQCRDADAEPVRRIQAVILDLLQDVSDAAIQNANLGQLCDLLRLSSSASIQTTAYRVLARVVRTRTEKLVLDVEASVAEAEEGHASKEIALPAELVSIVESARAIDWHGEVSVSQVLGHLLAWMTVLDHFDDASRTLRWAYLDQINTLHLLDEGLLPLLFSILGISEVGAWNFGSSAYEVDEYYPDLLEPEELPDLAPLASHVYYRALVTLPSGMRTYYESLKDRQLSMSMLAFTARHYSPVIIRHEFSALREPAAMALLSEEGLNVRIAQGGGAMAAGSAGASEAIASYTVDEQPMEIGIRLPAEFPLKGVDVRDLRRVGVPENKWRGWLMSLQQTITSRNGLILEALSVFKKNVALHFEGVVECAICYSIISLTDRTLPTKPCRTCKNRFHASCLFKWFNSSHSSSCPMCRALF